MLLDKLTSELHLALKNKDKLRSETLRFLIADVKRYKIDHYPPGSDKSLTDEDVVKIVRKQVKSHQESISAFKKGGRNDLVEKETKELEILKKYLPAQLNPDQLNQIIDQAVSEVGDNFGVVMSRVMKNVAGKADGKIVAQMLKEKLSK